MRDEERRWKIEREIMKERERKGRKKGRERKDGVT